MATNINLVRVTVTFIKKGDKFIYDNAECALKSPIEDFALEISGESFMENFIAEVDNVFFQFNTIPLPMQHCNLNEEIANIGCRYFFEPFLLDFEKVARKIVENEKAKYNNLTAYEKERTVVMEDCVEFIALIEERWVYSSSYYEQDEYEMEADFVGILDNDLITKSANTIEEFLAKQIAPKKQYIFEEEWRDNSIPLQ